MMLALFFIFLVILVLIVQGKKDAALYLGLLNLLLVLGILIHHATDKLMIRL